MAVMGAGTAQAARTPELLRDVAPASVQFSDRVIDGASVPVTARASQSHPYRSYKLSTGEAIRVAVSSSYAETPGLAESYVAFLETLPHGEELSQLRVVIATPEEVSRTCGGGSATLACYVVPTETMYVPGDQRDAGRGVTTSYVVAHEYGHHLANNRSNAPFPAVNFGPKYWSSHEKVCANVASGRLALSAEGDDYVLNPGESWAEVYARLHYRDVPWRLASLLKPNDAALTAAARDVSDPWTKPIQATYRGRLDASRNRRSFSFSLTLDGAASFKLRGPERAEFDLRVSSDGRVLDTTSRAGSRDSLRYSAACRDRTAQRIKVTVLRRSGKGAFALGVKYAG